MKGYLASFVAVAAVATLLSFAVPSDSDADSPITNVATSEDLAKALTGTSGTVRITADMTLDSDLTVPSGITVLIPFSDGDFLGSANGTDDCSRQLAAGNRCFLTVTLNANLTVNGKLIVGGVLGYPDTFSYQGHTSGAHSVLVNNGSVDVPSGGKLECYGFIRGTGTVTASSGSVITEPLVINDYVGADKVYAMNTHGQGAFDRYSLPNIQCTLTIDAGSTLLGKITMYARGQYVSCDLATVVGPENAFITLSEGATLTMEYDPSRSIDTNESYYLHGDIGKTTITIDGGATFGAITVSFKTKYPIQYDGTFSYEEQPFSIPYNLDIILSNGNYLMNNDYRLLPGSRVVLEEDATLGVNGSLTAYWGLNDKRFKDTQYPTTAILTANGFDASGRLIVKGNMYLLDKGCLYGIAEMGGPSATIQTSKLTHTSECTVDFGWTGTAHIRIPVFGITISKYVDTHTARTMAGYIVDGSGNLVIMEPGSFYRAGTSSNYTMAEYTQTDGTYALGTAFQGGWEKVQVSYTAVNGSLNGPLTLSALDDMLSSAGVSDHYRLNLTVSSLDGTVIEQGAVTAIRGSGSVLNLTDGSISVTFSSESLRDISGGLRIALNSTALTPAQKSATDGKSTYNFELYDGIVKQYLLPGTVNFTLPFVPANESEKSKVNIWYVYGYGEIESYAASYGDDTISFDTTSLGCLAISLDNVPSKNSFESGHLGLYIGIGAGAVLAALAVVAILYFRKK